MIVYGLKRLRMMRYLSLLLISGFSILSSYQSLMAQPCQFTPFPWFGGEMECYETSPFDLVFEDQFDTDTINRQDWVTYYPYTIDGSDNCKFCRTHGPGRQVYKDENVVVKDGLLLLKVIREPTEWMGEKRDFSSGVIYSVQPYLYGKFEIKCKLPKGRGYWPAFWLFGDDEMDIFEVCTHEPNSLNSNLHMNCNGDSFQDPKSHTVPDLTENFHVIAAEWNPKYVEWSVDGIPIRRINRFKTMDNKEVVCGDNVGAGTLLNNNLIPNEYMHVIVGLAVISKDGSYCEDYAADESTPNVAQMEIDYIRIYQKDEKHKTKLVSVFPNPVSNMLSFKLNSDVQLKKLLIVNEVTMYSVPVGVINGQQIDVSRMVAGKYHLEFHNTLGDIFRSQSFIIYK